MKKLKKLVIVIVLLGCNLGVYSQVGINTADPDTSAILHIVHNTKGVLFPNIDDVEQVNEVNGMFIFKTTDNKFYYYQSSTSSWQCINPFYSTDTTNASLKGELTVKGNLTVQPESTISGFGTVPLGGIIMWSGEHDAIPDGWALCNGEVINSIQTPDLRGRFVVGHSIGSSGSNDPAYSGVGNMNSAVSNDYNYVKNIGGNKTNSLVKDNIPEHNHDKGTLYIQSSGDHSHGYRIPGLGDGQTKFDEVGAGDSENIYHISATTLLSSHTHPNSSFAGSTGLWGGNVLIPPVTEIDTTGNPCKYDIEKEGCTDNRPFTNYLIESINCNGTYPLLKPEIDPVTGELIPLDPEPISNPNFFANKPECLNSDYNPDYGDVTELVAGYYGVLPVENRPPYYVLAFIIRVK